jgi:hypothetical protein
VPTPSTKTHQNAHQKCVEEHLAEDRVDQMRECLAIGASQRPQHGDQRQRHKTCGDQRRSLHGIETPLARHGGLPRRAMWRRGWLGRRPPRALQVLKGPAAVDQRGITSAHVISSRPDP